MAAAYPTIAEIETFLSAQGITGSTETQRTQARAAAIAAWERMTGFTPFLGEAGDSTRYYNAPNSRYMPFPGGYVSITSVTTGVSLDSSGTVQTASRHYWPNPQDGTPILGLELDGYWYGAPRSIKVVGKRGYSATLPDDVFLAILQGAASQVYQQVNQLSTGGLESISIGQGDLSLKFAGNKQVESWAQYFVNLASYPPYRRLGL